MRKKISKRNLIQIIPVLLFLIVFPGLINKPESMKIPFAKNDDSVNIWWSSELIPGSIVWYKNPPSPDAIRYKLSVQKPVYLKSASNEKNCSFRIDTALTFQSVSGIGTSLEATSIHALLKNKSEQEVSSWIRVLLDSENGMGLNMFRITIGTSDFSDGRACSKHPKGFYSYQDDPDKPFSIQPDVDLKIVHVLQMVIEEAARLKQPVIFFASIWSPPAWMKTSENLIGGTLKKGYEGKLANYFRQFIEAYEEKGIPVYALTVQNEPNFLPDSYPGMLLSPEQERDIAIAIHNEFVDTTGGKRRINTRIWINDHNMDNWENPKWILTDLKSKGLLDIIDGVAFHHYEPRTSPESTTKLHNLFPDKDMHLTEHSEWGVSGMYNIQNYFLNWSRSYIYWVPMTTIKTDECNQGPYNTMQELSPPLFIERGVQTSDIYVTPEYYLLSQFSKFVRPGAIRVECNKGSVKNLTSVVFRNKDNTMIQILVNQTSKEQKFVTWFGNRCFESLIPPKSVGTCKWK
ncbi:MAG: glycoside hydrolase family 30 beta sandwich domain-containing protein [Bacteroidales bacterium]